MKEVSFKLYEFDELSDKSRKAVVERRRYQVGEESAQSYSEDWAASLEKFQEIMGITVRYDVPYDGSCSSYSFDFNEAIYDNEECIIWGDKVKGRLLARFLNKIYYRVRSRKYIHSGMRKHAVYCDGKKSRYSNIMWEENNCPLTGYIYDCPLLEPIYEWHKKWDMEISLYDLIDKCLYKFFTEWEDEMEHCYDNEFVEEMISVNSQGDWYYEDGTLYDGPMVV